MKIEKVAVIGAGATGRRLAALFAAAGFVTTLEDILPSNLRQAAEFLSTALVDAADSNPIRFASSIEAAVRDADLAIDSVPDELESKQEIFSLLDRMAPPHTILLTPTRVLSIADLASCTYRADRCLGIELPVGDLSGDGRVKLVSTSLTLAEVLNAVSTVCAAIGFTVEQRPDPAEISVAAGTFF
jgi:3-hydroxybutyryl-CoA dehydrogenase